MSRSWCAIVMLVLSLISRAQVTQTKYYKDEHQDKEVGPEGGKFSKTIIENSDGSITTEFRNMKKNSIMWSETYKGEEPYGKWLYNSSAEEVICDYNFPVRYSDEKCKGTISLVKTEDYFKDDINLGYAAPKILTGETTIEGYITHNLEFTFRARAEGLQGTVYITFTVTKESEVDNIYVSKGANILLDKEALRVMRHLKFSTPPVLKGLKESFCSTVPVTFKLQQ